MKESLGFSTWKFRYCPTFVASELRLLFLKVPQFTQVFYSACQDNNLGLLGLNYLELSQVYRRDQ